MGRHCYGQIVYARVRNREGKVKERTVLIIASDHECDAGDRLLVLAISSNFREPPPAHHILVHDNSSKDAVTGLDRPCVVKCNFADEITQASIRRIVGQMPVKFLLPIVETFDRLYADDKFTDWH